MENVKLEYCYDGDTCAFLASELPPPFKRFKVRVLGVDTPEIRGKCPLEKERAKRAKEFTLSELKGQEIVLVFDSKRYKDSFGRSLAKIEYAGKDLSHELIKNGHGVKYSKKNKPNWCKAF